MVKPRKATSPEQLDALCRGTQNWRQARKVPGAMLGEPWDRAAALAKEYSVCRITRALTPDCTSLRKRTENVPARGLVKPPGGMGW